jgi:hypothetical protein
MKSEMRKRLAQLPFEEKIRKVGELIRLSREVKGSTKEALRAGLDNADPEPDAAKRRPPRASEKAFASGRIRRVLKNNGREGVRVR